MATSITAPEFRRARSWLRGLLGALLLLGLAIAWLDLRAFLDRPATLDLVIAELQLMAGVWEPENPEALPWKISIMRVVVPVATTGFAFLLAVDLFTWVRSLTRNHIVLVGRGAAATTICARLRRPNGEDGPKQRVLVTAEGDEESLRSSGIRRAKAIVVCGDDTFDTATNIDTTEVAMTLARRKGFIAHLLVGDPGLALALRARRMVKPENEDRRIRIYTVDELAARHQIRQVPPDAPADPHLLVVGDSPFCRALIVEIARRWSLGGDRTGRPLVTLVAPGAARTIEEITDRWPFVPTTCSLRALEQPIEDAMLTIPERPYRSYFGDANEEHALRTALTAATRWRPEKGSIVVRLTRLSSQTDAYPDLFENLGGALDQVSVYDAAAQEILLGEEPLLAFARGIHESYVDDALRRGETLGSRPLLRPWDELPDEAKESNLQQAKAFPRTLATIRCSVAPRSRLADPFYFRPGEVETLARAEHEHWRAEQLSAGWRYGPERCDEHRVHPLLVPWEQLSLADQTRNRAIVRARPLLFDRVLEREGLQIVRLATEAGDAGEAAAFDASWLAPKIVERLAQRIHEKYLAARLAEGEQMGARPALHAWADLSEEIREQNRAQARDIAAKIDLLEATITAEKPARPFVLAEDEIEMLSRYEHDRWLSQKVATGWTYGPERDDAKKVSHLLVPWLYLPESEREMDRRVVRSIPELVEAAGWYVVRR